MAICNKYSPIVLLAMSVVSQESYATTQYSSEAQLSLEVVGFSDSAGNAFDFDSKPSSLVITSFDNSNENNTSTSNIGDAFSDAVSTPFSVSNLIDLDTQATGVSEAPSAFAGSDAFASASFGFENTSLTETYAIDMLLSYSYSAIVETDTLTAKQNGLAGVDIDLFGDFNLDQILAVSISTDIGQGLSEGGEIDREIRFLLGAGDFESVFANISSYGESESVSSVSEVPLPTSIYLMGSALAGLIRRGKSKKV